MVEVRRERAGSETDTPHRRMLSKRGIGVPCASSRVGACGLQNRRPCRRVSSKRRDRAALHELEGGSARAAGPTPVPPCVVQTRDRTVCPSAGSGCRARARGWERAARVGARGLQDRHPYHRVSSEHWIAGSGCRARARGWERERTGCGTTPAPPCVV
ncbi:hypothetical protein B0H14DRAFT_1623093 [Mycena olivaceomarginata]|nr:hypothetical protein B0H14DRAFT_1623093 [Mycena olivaceomarginata]